MKASEVLTRSAPPSGHVRIPALVVVAGVLITAALFWKARNETHQRFRAEFDGDASLRANIIVDALEERLMDVDALRRFYLGSTSVDREEFKAFIGPVPGARAGIEVMAWVPRVSSEELAVLQAAAQSEGLTNFQFREFDAQRGLVPAASGREAYFPVYQMEPWAGNEELSGLDLASIPTCLEALRLAGGGNRAVATGKISLERGSEGQPLVMVFVPVYRSAAPLATAEERQAALHGFAVGMFHIGAVLASVLQPTPQMGLPVDLVDLSAPPDQSLLYHWEPRFRSRSRASQNQGSAASGDLYQQAFDFAGRPWRLDVSAGPSYRRVRYSHAYWIIPPVGLAITGLLWFYLTTLVSHRMRAEKLVRDRTAALQEREATLEAITASAQDAIIMMDADGKISFWNPAAERILGWTAAKAKGEKLQDLVAPPTCPAPTRKVFDDLQAIGLGQAVGETLELALVTKDKREMSAELSLSSVVLNAKWHAVGILRDITERKRAEQQLARAEKKYHELVNNLTVGVYRNTPGKQGRFLEANPAMVAMFEAGSKEEILQHNVSDLYIDPQRRQEFSEKIMRQGFVKDEELELKTLRGRRFWASVSATMKKDDEENVFFDGVIEDITDRKRAEESLQRERILMRTVIDNLPDVIYAKDPACRKTLANRADLQIMGCQSEADVLGKTDFDFHPKEAAEAFFADDQAVIQSGQPILNREEFFIDMHGEQRWLLTSKLPLRDEHGQIIGLVGIGHDITERKRAEEAIQRERILLRTLIDNLPDAIYVKDTACRKTVANRADVRNMGRASEADVLGRNDFELFPSDVAQRFYADDQTVIQTGQPILNREEYFFDEKGEQRWLLTSKLPLRDERGQIIGLVGIGHDITVRKRVEETIQRERILLRTLIDNLPDAVYVKDTAGRKTVANRADYQNMGRQSEAEVLGKTDFDVFPKDVAARFHADDQAVLRTGEAVLNREELLFDAQGGERWLLTSKLPLRDERGQIIGLVGIGHDITERKRAEERLRLLSRAVEQNPASIIITDPQGCIEYVNPKFTEVSGYALEEVKGRTPRFLKSGVTPPETFTQLWQTITSGGVWQGELCNRRKNGSLFWEAASISPVTDAAGQVTHFVAVKEDITEMKRAEEELRQAKEAAEAASRAKSEFLANMSHEIRTPMNGVIGMTGLLLDTELNREQREYAETIRNSGETLLTLINDVLDFSKIEAGRFELEVLDFDLRQVVEDTADMLALRAHQKGLEFICLLEPQVPSLVQGDPGRLRQVLTNLAGNAIKFTAQGEVSIHASLESERGAKTVVRFEVTDTGIGIPADKLSRLFMPFTQVDASTTRRFGGSGLGLSISRRLVEMMGGRIGVESVEGRGSKFWFKVEFGQPAAEARLAWKPAAEISGRRALVVDDNATNRRVLTLLLKSWGCEFEEAADGESALLRLHATAASNRPFDVVLLDMHMPGMDGEEVGRRIKADPVLAALPLVMLTSLSERGHAERLKQIGFAGFLTKPVKQTQLYQCLALVLGGPQAALEEQAPRFITSEALPEARKRKQRILLAEDNITNQKVALAILDKLGYRADAVANGREVLKSLEAIPYRLVLMDCQMPEMDGYEATRIIRDPTSNVRSHDVPVIAMTAYAMQGDREKCLEAGMNDYISKPVQPRELAEALERWLGEGEPAAAAPPPASAPVPDTPAAVFDEADLLDRMMGDEEMVRNITRSFVREAAQHIAGLKASLDGVDIPTATRHAHSLKGSSANLGAPALRDTAAEIERLIRAGDHAQATQLLPELAQRFETLKEAMKRFLGEDGS